MQSDRDSFYAGDVVLENFNMASSDEENIWDQIYEMQICIKIYNDDFNFLWYDTKMHININYFLKFS